MSALQDTQSELDDRRLPIDRVGVRSLRFPMRIRDRDAAVQHTVATVSLAVDLPHQFKGTHMSRFVEILHAHGTELTVSNIVAMPRELMKKLHADKAHVEMRFPYFRAKKAHDGAHDNLCLATERLESAIDAYNTHVSRKYGKDAVTVPLPGTIFKGESYIVFHDSVDDRLIGIPAGDTQIHNLYDSDDVSILTPDESKEGMMPSYTYTVMNIV